MIHKQDTRLLAMHKSHTTMGYKTLTLHPSPFTLHPSQDAHPDEGASNSTMHGTTFRERRNPESSTLLAWSARG